MDYDQRLRELGLILPEPASPAATYVPYVQVGELLFISGQITLFNKDLQYIGKVGEDFTLEEAQGAARLCAMNVLSQVHQACEGTLNKVIRCVRLGGFVNCVDGYTDQPRVINGASQLMVDVFGDQGKHARAAVGVNALPLGIAVEVEATFQVKT